MLFGGTWICSLFFFLSRHHTLFLKTSESCVISSCVYIYVCVCVLSFISYIYNHIYISYIYHIYIIYMLYHIYIIFIFTYSSRIYTLDKVGGDLTDGFQRMGTLVHPKTIGPQITNVPLAEV